MRSDAFACFKIEKLTVSSNSHRFMQGVQGILSCTAFFALLNYKKVHAKH